MAKKRKAKPRRKSRFWYVYLDKRCKLGCCEYEAGSTVGVSRRKCYMLTCDCGCIVLPVDAPDCTMSLPEYRARFANAPRLVPGGPPVKVRLRMEVV